MKAAIHQPHYFPWLGYFDKMAKTDIFVLLDQVQLEKNSQMIKNRVLDKSGNIKYITISGETKGFLDKEYREILTKDISGWTSRQMNALKDYYRKARYGKEIFSILEEFLAKDYPTICQWSCASIELVRGLLGITTPLIFQSDIDYDRNNRRSDLIYSICQSIGADTYFSGRGASIVYLDREKFAKNGIKIIFQSFHSPAYPQCNSPEFVPGISVLDMLFNLGIEETRRVFWENVDSTHEFDGAQSDVEFGCNSNSTGGTPRRVSSNFCVVFSYVDLLRKRMVA